MEEFKNKKEMNNDKLDPQLKKEWCDALESGDFKQGNGYLCDYDVGIPKYCCLGVLLKIKGFDSEILAGVEMPIGIVSNHDKIPSWIFEHHSIDDKGLAKNTATFLANMNDKGKDFKEISQWIKENL